MFGKVTITAVFRSPLWASVHPVQNWH